MGKDNENNLVLIEKDLKSGATGIYGNILIGSSRNFTVTEERYLMLLVAKASEQLSKYKKLAGHRYSPDEAICPSYVYFSPKVLLTPDSKKYDEIRQKAENFAKKIITTETRDDKGHKITRIVHLAGPIVIRSGAIGQSYIKLSIERELWELILDMSKGFTYLDIKYLFRLSRPEAMRLLPMFYNSSMLKKDESTIEQYDLTYNLNTLKHMFGLDKSYKTKSGTDDYANFVKKVIKPALDEIRNSGCPFYADYELLAGEREDGHRGRAPVNMIRLIPRRNRTIFQSVYPCLLNENSPIRSATVLKNLQIKYGFGEQIPKQVENVVCFAQNYIIDDNDLWNMLYDVYPQARAYEKGLVAGLIDQVKRYVKKRFDVEYFSPSKIEKERKRIAKDGRKYTDWELVSLPDAETVDLLPADIERHKLLVEAQAAFYGRADFKLLVQEADKLQEEHAQMENDDIKLVYGIEHLSDYQIYENVIAGVIDDKNTEQYDEESYRRLNFITGLMMDCNMTNQAFTWEYTQQKLATEYYHQSSAPATTKTINQPANKETMVSNPNHLDTSAFD